MSKYVLFLIFSFVCAILLALPGLAADSGDRRDRVCIYKDENFHGHEQCYLANGRKLESRNIVFGSRSAS